MKKIFIVLFAAIVCTGAFAQKNVASGGVGAAYGFDSEHLGVGVKFNYGITDQIRVVPSFTYYLKKDFVSYWDLAAEGNYLFPLGGCTVYPLAGLAYTNTTVSVDLPPILGGGSTSNSDGKFGLNLGGGIEFPLGGLKLGAELKYNTHQEQIIAGVNVLFAF